MVTGKQYRSGLRAYKKTLIKRIELLRITKLSGLRLGKMFSVEFDALMMCMLQESMEVAKIKCVHTLMTDHLREAIKIMLRNNKFFR